MRINTNISAVIANGYLQRSDSSLSKSMERLSSGLKINKSADDSAGMAIAAKLKAQIRGLERASDNASDGVSVVQSAEGALNEVHTMVARIRELAVQGANGTVTQEDREAIQDEVKALHAEMERIAQDTEFNGKNLLDGSLDRRTYTNYTGVETMNVSDYVKAGDYGITVHQLAQHAVLGSSDNPNHPNNLDFSDGTGIFEGGVVTEAAEGVLDLNGIRIELKAGETRDQVLSDLTVAAGKVDLIVNAADYSAISIESTLYGSDIKIKLNTDNSAIAASCKISNLETGKEVSGDDMIASFTPNPLLAGTYLGYGNSSVMVCRGMYATITDNSGFSMVIKVDPDSKNVTDEYDALYAQAVVDELDAIHNDTSHPNYNPLYDPTVDGPPMLIFNPVEMPIISEVTDIGMLTVHIGANENQIMDVRIPELSLESMGMLNMNCLTQEGCGNAISMADEAIAYVSSARSSLGAFQNRLEAAVGSLDVTTESMTAALSSLEDVDMAAEMTEYTKLNVLSQAGVSMVAQANERPQQILQLLQ